MAGLHSYYGSVLGVPMTALRYVDADLAFAKLADTGRLYEMAFGDAVMDVAQADGRAAFTIVGGRFHGRRASVKGALALREEPLLRLSMIDVQQGDGLILETPGGKLVFIDGGDNQLFARHVAACFAGSTADKPLEVDALIVTHGDADHFDGLTELVKSETLSNVPAEPTRERKRVFMHPAAVLHNGLVKRPDTRPELERLGPTQDKNGRLHLTGLVDSPLGLPAAEMNKFFRAWAATLEHWGARRQALGRPPIAIARVAHNKKAGFAFLASEPDIGIDVLGPIATKLGGQPALPFLRRPPETVELHLGLPEGAQAPAGSYSASHTINGHSIAFRLRYRNVRFMFTGDLNQESMDALRKALPTASLRSEVLKVPHHGSADFDLKFLKDVSPVVSIVSSGDESSAKEYIHPRASLLSALGRASRGDTGVIFITELAAFFAVRGYARPLRPAQARPFFAFERTNFGIVHIRTDGQRVLAFTHSGKHGMNEAYGFRVDAAGRVRMTAKLNIARG
jgi:beta-lactamase superfamily II metal-dependent hydrolase